mmetsp:Transcript_7351/g.21297  ORF Transcript_7351/g.21297 Transcript_7351/m.21297 type:complete len:226 (-) Transcript_7351:1051-1728(-)
MNSGICGTTLYSSQPNVVYPPPECKSETPRPKPFHEALLHYLLHQVLAILEPLLHGHIQGENVLGVPARNVRAIVSQASLLRHGIVKRGQAVRAEGLYALHHDDPVRALGEELRQLLLDLALGLRGDFHALGVHVGTHKTLDAVAFHARLKLIVHAPAVRGVPREQDSRALVGNAVVLRVAHGLDDGRGPPGPNLTLKHDGGKHLFAQDWLATCARRPRHVSKGD